MLFTANTIANVIVLDDIHKSEATVSKSTLNLCGGVPIDIMP